MILNHDFGGILTSFWVSFYFGSLPTLLKPLTYHRLKIDGWKRSFISMGQNMVPLRGPIILLSFSGVVISLPEKNQPVFFFPCGKKAFKKPRCLARGKHGHVFMFIFFFWARCFCATCVCQRQILQYWSQVMLERNFFWRKWQKLKDIDLKKDSMVLRSCELVSKSSNSSQISSCKLIPLHSQVQAGKLFLVGIATIPTASKGESQSDEMLRVATRDDCVTSDNDKVKMTWTVDMVYYFRCTPEI